MASAARGRAGLWAKMIVGGTAVCVGGPALVWYVTPTEEQLIEKYNPELKKRALENREQRQQDFDNFVNKLKEYSKSDKPIWEAAAEDEARTRALMLQSQRQAASEQAKRREEIKQQALNGR